MIIFMTKNTLHTFNMVNINGRDLVVDVTNTVLYKDSFFEDID